MKISTGKSALIEKIENYDFISKLIQIQLNEDYKKGMGHVEGFYGERGNSDLKRVFQEDGGAVTTARAAVRGNANRSIEFTNIAPGELKKHISPNVAATFENGATFNVTNVTDTKIEFGATIPDLVTQNPYVGPPIDFEGDFLTPSENTLFYKPKIDNNQSARYNLIPYGSGFFRMHEYYPCFVENGLEDEITQWSSVYSKSILIAI